MTAPRPRTRNSFLPAPPRAAKAFSQLIPVLSRQEVSALSPEARRERRLALHRVAQAKFERSDRGREIAAKYVRSAKGRVRYDRFRAKPDAKILERLRNRTPGRVLYRTLWDQANPRDAQGKRIFL